LARAALIQPPAQLHAFIGRIDRHHKARRPGSLPLNGKVVDADRWFVYRIRRAFERYL
jgi:hypothetical protein